jgi:hypothetical protein
MSLGESMKMLKQVDYYTRNTKRDETRSFPSARPQTRKNRRRTLWRYVEGFFDPRTQLGRGHVLARLGMGGCNGAFFSIFS